MDALVILIPLFPLAAALIIASGMMLGLLRDNAQEVFTAELTTYSLMLSSLMAGCLFIADLAGKNQGTFSTGEWLNSDTLAIHFNFISSGLSVRLAALFSLLLSFISHFSIRYLLHNRHFHLYFFILSLCSFAALIGMLSGNALGTLIGLEIAGVGNYFVLSYVFQRPTTSLNALHAFIADRLGHAAFIVGISLIFVWHNTLNWADINALANEFTVGEATGISLCFTLTACAKSAQLPFTLSALRTMDAPLPANTLFFSGFMLHSGVFLVCLLQPIFSRSPFAMAILAILGMCTTVFSYLTGQTQTNAKSILAFSATGQLGLMFIECGLGFFEVASWHLMAHALVLCIILLTPQHLQSLVSAPKHPTTLPFGLYTAALHYCWLNQIIEWAFIKPIRGLAVDLSYFDDHIIDRMMGVPKLTFPTLSSLAHNEIPPLTTVNTAKPSHILITSSGVAGQLTELAATSVHWFEKRFVADSLNRQAVRLSRQLGHTANRCEQIILRPRYLILFVCITFLVAF